MKRPLPTASIMPSCGFSLAVSGRTMPLLVFSSRSTGLITTRSPSGLNFMRDPPSVGWFSTQLVRVLMILESARSFKGPGAPRGARPLGISVVSVGEPGSLPELQCHQHVASVGRVDVEECGADGSQSADGGQLDCVARVCRAPGIEGCEDISQSGARSRRCIGNSGVDGACEPVTGEPV